MESVFSSGRPGCHALSAVFFLLPPCVIFLALDLALRRCHRATISVAEDHTSESASLKSTTLSLPTPKETLAQDVAVQRTQSLPTPSPSIHGSATSTRTDFRRRNKQPEIRPEFMRFCENLVQTNRIWAQEREIKRLEEALESATKAHQRVEFDALCRRQLLENELSRAQNEAKGLREERDRLSLLNAEFAAEMQKKHAIEELAKDVRREAEETRRLLDRSRTEHEREIREMVEECRKESRQLREEIAQLRLAQEAKAVEQAISNELEDRALGSNRQSATG
ncbi:hypothetical protein CC1G_02692 [Coprinopsis cinerea okayama7|uniref:Uncharacterized protein n=1 Tax=Coprinopsis cinerea (strain Okayama-7 / 130 / ATCC MYA-4618 / FGSC 9003) TaxID=240176 RepID=A8PBN7_COPC7|nr:hypothetical protein CC1G_02692 [Coprinopsis cinerea okayama7\|eukprot:XP_001840229.1 hypothetical protein CC1G_02692 [Coprinopsis cinerea okayama7\